MLQSGFPAFYAPNFLICPAPDLCVIISIGYKQRQYTKARQWKKLVTFDLNIRKICCISWDARVVSKTSNAFLKDKNWKQLNERKITKRPLIPFQHVFSLVELLSVSFRSGVNASNEPKSLNFFLILSLKRHCCPSNFHYLTPENFLSSNPRLIFFERRRNRFCKLAKICYL